MKKLVIIPGGFHPFHSGHRALYQSALNTWPSADIFLAATADTSARPFPFDVKKKLATIAGIPQHKFIQVKSPFQAKEIVQLYDPASTILIFARSEKERNQQPFAGGTKKDGSPSYLQPYKTRGLQPMSQHGYIAYLPVAQFGPGMTSATEIRGKWPEMDQEQKQALVNDLYPATASNSKLEDLVVRILDNIIGGQDLEEAKLHNDPESGHIIYVDQGLGGYRPDQLKKVVGQHMITVLDHIRNDRFREAEYMLTQWDVIEHKVKALKEYYNFIQQQKSPLPADKFVDLARQPNDDYVDEAGQSWTAPEHEDKPTQQFANWKSQVYRAYPEYADRMRFVHKGDQVSAEVPGLDRSFGLFDLRTHEAAVLQ